MEQKLPSCSWLVINSQDRSILNWIYSKVHYINSTERINTQILLVTSQLLFGICRVSLWLSEPGQEENLISFECCNWLVSCLDQNGVNQNQIFVKTSLFQSWPWKRKFLAGCSPVCSVILLSALEWSCSACCAPTMTAADSTTKGDIVKLRHVFCCYT